MNLGSIHNQINSSQRVQELGALDQLELMMKRHEETRRIEKANQAQFNLPELTSQDAQRTKQEQPKHPTAPQSYEPKAPQKPQKPKKGGLEETARKMADAKGNNNGQLDAEELGDYKTILAQLQAAEGGGDGAGDSPPSLASYTPPTTEM